MRQAIEHTRKADGTLGIRSGVWLIALSLALMGLLPLGFFRRQPTPLTREAAPEAVSSLASTTRPQPGARWASHIKFTPAFYERDSGDDSALMSVVEQMTQDRRTWVDGGRER